MDFTKELGGDQLLTNCFEVAVLCTWARWILVLFVTHVSSLTYNNHKYLSFYHDYGPFYTYYNHNLHNSPPHPGYNLPDNTISPLSDLTIRSKSNEKMRAGCLNQLSNRTDRHTTARYWTPTSSRKRSKFRPQG